VTKFELTEDEYAKKTGTVRDFMKKNKMGKYNAEEVAQIEKEKAEAEKMEKEAASKIAVADRCEVAVPGQVTRRGKISILSLQNNLGGTNACNLQSAVIDQDIPNLKSTSTC
jgi:tubulin-folding cofactor B